MEIENQVVRLKKTKNQLKQNKNSNQLVKQDL